MGRGDTLFVLGDFALSNPSRWKRMIGKKHIYIINGHHDMDKSHNLPPMLVWADGIRVWCSHYPHLGWPGKGSGVLHAHGHTHGHTSRNGWRPVGSIDVGWDFRRGKLVPMSKMQEIAADEAKYRARVF